MHAFCAEIETKDGAMKAHICHPDGEGPWPAIIMLMDAPGVREELHEMARRLAIAGYFVVLPDLYYRTGNGITIDGTNLREDGPDRKRMIEMIGTINTGMVVEDIEAVIGFIQSSTGAQSNRIGCLGYCMSGPFAYAAAAKYANQIQAVATLFGTFMVTDTSDSPHLLTNQISAEVYVGFAENDRFSPPELIQTMREKLQECNLVHEVEVYPGVDHAFTFPSRHAYNRVATDRHWERLISLYDRALKTPGKRH